MVARLPPGTKLREVTTELKEPLSFSDCKVVIVAVGHMDLEVHNSIFMDEYRQVLDFVRRYNPACHLILCGTLPTHEESRQHRMSAYKSGRIRDHAKNNPKAEFFDAYSKLQVNRRIPEEYVCNGLLNALGLRNFVVSVGHKIASVQDIWKK